MEGVERTQERGKNAGNDYPLGPTKQKKKNGLVQEFTKEETMSNSRRKNLKPLVGEVVRKQAAIGGLV